MFINYSNHPSDHWGEKQKAAAACYGEILDMPFPQVDPQLDIEEIRDLVGIQAEKIRALKPDAVLAAGEFTFLFMLVDKLLSDGINVMCSCSSRDTVEELRPDGSLEKKSVFVFERFRPYRHYED